MQIVQNNECEIREQAEEVTQMQMWRTQLGKSTSDPEIIANYCIIK